METADQIPPCLARTLQQSVGKGEVSFDLKHANISSQINTFSLVIL